MTSLVQYKEKALDDNILGDNADESKDAENGDNDKNWIEQGTAISLVPVTKALDTIPLRKKRRVAVGKKTMSEKVKQRIQHRKKKQLAVKKRQLLPEIVEGGSQNNDAISLATNDGKTLTNVVPTSLLGKKRKKIVSYESLRKGGNI